MAKYDITSPDGEVFEIEAPDNATEQEVLSYAQSQFSKPEIEQPIQPLENANPTDNMNFGETALAGIGKSFVDTGRGLKQFGAQIGNKMGVVSDDTVNNINQEVNRYAELDKPLMNTAGGLVGNIAGQAVQFAAPAAGLSKAPLAANLARSTIGKYLAAAAGGAAFGSTQPVTEGNTRAGAAAFGAAGGVIGQGVSDVVPKIASAYGAKAAAKVANKNLANAQTIAAAKEAKNLGYVIPPADLNPGMVSELASGISGKIKTAQVASARNQAITDKLARKALGVADDVPLNLDTLNAIRSKAGADYAAVANVGKITTNPNYTKALDDAVKPFLSQSKSFPDRAMPAIVKDIESLKTGNFDAGDAIETIKILRNDADKAYRAGDNLVGKAYKKAAEALEDSIESHLVRTNTPKALVDSYKASRKTIAKTYTIQNALNPETGAVDAAKLARLIDKGKPIESEILQIAKTAKAFPKATQSLKEAPKAISPLDYGTAVIAAAGTGNVMPLALIGARPALRSTLLSKTVQNSAINNMAAKQSLASRILPKALDNDLVRKGAVPVGVALSQ
jgi:chaperonin cofactor prefoldin